MIKNIRKSFWRGSAGFVLWLLSGLGLVSRIVDLSNILLLLKH